MTIPPALAVEGGEPSRLTSYPVVEYGAALIDAEEALAATRVLESHSLFRYYGASVGGEVSAFEQELRGIVGADVLCVSSGTTALRIALKALGIGKNQEVLVPAYTFQATINAIVSVGANPVFVEVDDSFTINPSDAESKIGSRTSAILPVHLQGKACDMEKLSRIARRHKLLVIEDCAQACGVCFDGQAVGSIGNIGAFSFQQNKLLCTGEGGAITTANHDIMRRAQILHDQGGHRLQNSYPDFNHNECAPGENARMSELTAAIGRVQLKRIPGMLQSLGDMKREIVSEAKSLGLQLSPTKPGSTDAGVSVAIILSDEARRDVWLHALKAENVGATKHYGSAVYENRMLSSYITGDTRCSRTEELSRQTVWINLHPKFSETEIAQIIEALRKCAYYLGV